VDNGAGRGIGPQPLRHFTKVANRRRGEIGDRLRGTGGVEVARGDVVDLTLEKILDRHRERRIGGIHVDMDVPIRWRSLRVNSVL
jgi:hypothetical protein